MAGKEHVLHVISHTHWDREWYLTFQRFRMRLVHLVDKLLDVLAKDPEFRYFHLDGQTVVLEDYLEIRPEKRELLARYVREGRILVGPWYILPDEFLVSGEATVRNLLLGERIARQFGERMPVGYIPDTFGHIGQMPQILRGFGLDNAVTWRGLSGGREELRSEFWWEAPDGSRLFALHLPDRVGYSNAPDLEKDLDALEAMARALEEELAAGAGTRHLLVMNGTDHKEPQPELPGLIAALNRRLDTAEVVHDTLPSYIATVRRAHEEQGSELQVHTGEFRDTNFTAKNGGNFILAGVLSTRMYLKLANEAAQTSLERWAEPFAALAWHLLGREHPGALLWQSWKYLLQNHPHDSICGCSIDPVHEQMETRFAWSKEIADQIALESLRQLARAAAKTAAVVGASDLYVFNPLARRRTDRVEAVVDFPADANPRGVALYDADGAEVPCRLVSSRVVARTYNFADIWPDNRFVREARVEFVAADVPAIGYRRYRVVAEAKPTSPARAQWRFGGRESFAHASGNVLENEFLLVTARPDGTLDVLDKTTGRVITGCHYFEDGGDNGDEYTYSPPREDAIVSSKGSAYRVAIIAAGPSVATIRVDGRLLFPEGLTPDRQARAAGTVAVPLATYVTLAAGVPRVDIRTVVENQARDHRLRAIVATGIRAAAASATGQFDVVTRDIAIRHPEKEFWIEDQPATQPTQGFVDVSDGGAGVALLTRGLPEYEIVKTSDGTAAIALTLIRAVGALGASDGSTIAAGAGPALPTPGAQCLRVLEFEYALLLHRGDWEKGDVLEEAHRFKAPLLAVQHPLPTDRVEPELPGPALPEDAGFVEVGPAPLAVTAVKKAEDRDSLLVRFYNPTSRPLRATVWAAGEFVAAYAVTLAEKRMAALGGGSKADGALPLAEETRQGLPGYTATLTIGPKAVATVEFARR